MSDKDQEQVMVTANNLSIHPPSKSSNYNMDTDYIHLSPHDEDWEREILFSTSFVPRWLAEKDSSIVQIIPYVICCTPDGKILSYKRKGGGEGRLEGKRSVGIGGHVNYLDNLAVSNDPTIVSWDTVKFGAVREIAEELDIEINDITNSLNEIGLIYTPLDGKDKCVTSNTPAVGAVHLGVIFTLEVDEKVTIRDNEGMISPKFISKIPKKLSGYETWSKMILEVFEEIRKN